MAACEDREAGESTESNHKLVVSPEPTKEEKRKASLTFQIEETEQKIADTQKRLDEIDAELGSVNAQEVVQHHIKLLHQYNELKDVATGLFGMIADRRGVRVKDVYEDFGVEEED